MQNLRNKTLAQIVTGDHRAASIMEKYHLDFCCKGKRSLEQACSEQHISPEELIEELEGLNNNKEETTAFEQMSMTQLIDHILLKHHTYVKTEGPQIMFYLQKVAGKHGDRHPELIRIFELFSEVKQEMDFHMQKEELILFPRIKQLDLPNSDRKSMEFLLAPISVMEQEHELAGGHLQEIRQLTNDYTPPQDACTTYKLSFAALESFEKDLHQHVHLENNILFPKAIRSLE
jgi:regulator of cell morphogenesis and NO signaling